MSTDSAMAALIEDMKSLIEAPATPIKQFGAPPTPYSEEAHQRGLVASTGMNQETRDREFIGEDGNNLGADQMITLGDDYSDFSSAGGNNPDYLMDGDMQTFMDDNY